MKLDRLLAPKSIAFIGGRDAAEAVRVCRRSGFQGAVWPVSASRAEMDGAPSVRRLSDLPAPPDAAFVGVNRHAALEVVAELSEIGAGGAVVYAAGFAETAHSDAQGAALQQALVRAAGPMPFLGPNCYGFVNAASGACLWPSEHGAARVPRGVAILCQSSNIAISLTMQRRGAPIAFVGTVGNQAQIGLSALGLAVIDAPAVTALGLHIEGLDDTAAFEALAGRARRLGKPIVALKTGRSEKAQASNLTHTASLSGADVVADAFFERLGVSRVRSLSAFLETLKLLHVHGALETPPQGPRVSAMCCSGGELALIADAAEAAGVSTPDLAPAHAAAVAETLPSMVHVANPLDYHTFIWADAPRMTDTFAAMMRGGFDLNLLTLDWPRTDRCSDADWRPAIQAMTAAARRAGARAGVMASLPENMPEAVAADLLEDGLVPLSGIEDALSAVAAAGAIGRAWSRPPAPALAQLGRAPAEVELLDEAASKAALRRFGLRTPAGEVATPATVRDAAQRLGGLVAVKALGVAHKTEARAVALNLTPDAAATAARSMADRIGAHRFLVEAMAPGAIAELIVGVKREAPYGLAMTIGAGGVYAELLDDTKVVLLPCAEEELRAVLDDLRVAPMLKGWRGGAAADLDAATAAIGAVAAFAMRWRDRLVELDVNPLILTARDAIAVDALVRAEPPAAPASPA